MKNLFDLAVGGVRFARCLGREGQHLRCLLCSKPLPFDGDGGTCGMGLVVRESTTTETVAVVCPECYSRFEVVQP